MVNGGYKAKSHAAIMPL